MIYILLILELLIKYVYLDYSFDNVKVLKNMELPNDFSGNIFTYPDSFYLNKVNNAIIENSEKIPHFPEILNNYKDYILHEIIKFKYSGKFYDVLITSNINIMNLFLLENTENENFIEFCNNDLTFDKKEKIIKILYLEEYTFAILFSTRDLVIYKFSYKTSRNLMINPLAENNCFLDKIYTITEVKDFYKLTQAKHLFVTLDFHGKIHFYNLKDYFMSRYQKFENIKSLQLGYYNQYFFSEIGSVSRSLLFAYDNRLALIKPGGKTKIIKIYYFNDEITTSLYSLDNFQVLVGTNKGNLHLISLNNSLLNFVGVINICKDNITLISQEKVNYLICLKCGKNFKLIDLKGKFNENYFDNEKYIETIYLLFFLLLSFIIKISKGKVLSIIKSNNDDDDKDFDV